MKRMLFFLCMSLLIEICATAFMFDALNEYIFVARIVLNLPLLVGIKNLPTARRIIAMI